jgi:hypothetical protein
MEIQDLLLSHLPLAPCQVFLFPFSQKEPFIYSIRLNEEFSLPFIYFISSTIYRDRDTHGDPRPPPRPLASRPLSGLPSCIFVFNDVQLFVHVIHSIMQFVYSICQVYLFPFFQIYLFTLDSFIYLFVHFILNFIII